MIRGNLLQCRKFAESIHILIVLVSINDSLDMLRFQRGFRILSDDLINGIDEKDFSLSMLGLFAPADHNAGFHRGIEKEIGTKTDDALNQIGFYQLLPHFALFIPEQHPVREKDRAATGIRLHGTDDMLEESIIGTALRRRPPDIPSEGIVCEHLAVPLLDRVRGIGQHDIELLKFARFQKCRIGQRVCIDDGEVLHAMQHQVHSRNGRCDRVQLRTVHPDVAPLLTLIFQAGQAFNQHATGTAGGVIDRIMALRLQDSRHQLHDRPVRVELLRRMTGVIRKLADQIFVCRAHLVRRTSRDGEMIASDL